MEFPRQPMTFPDDTQRLVIVGPTGSGKTQLGVFQLAHRDYHLMPWVVINYKREKLIDAIPHAHHIGLNDVPTRPGVYVIHPVPIDDDENVERFLREVWKRGDIGIFVDEGLMMGQTNASYRLLLTQGRSLYCPMIVLTQRPAWVDKFTFTESEFYEVFPLRFKGDIQTIGEYIPDFQNRRLPKYHFWHYDVAENRLVQASPVPKIEVILATFERRLRHKKIAV